MDIRTWFTNYCHDMMNVKEAEPVKKGGDWIKIRKNQFMTLRKNRLFKIDEKLCLISFLFCSVSNYIFNGLQSFEIICGRAGW